MSLALKIQRWFQTDRFLRQEATRWACVHFRGTNREIAQAVGYALVAMFNVDFKNLHRDTNLMTDLAADEWIEWAEVQMCLEEELEFYFAPEPAFAGQTIDDLVTFVSQPSLIRLQIKPKRRICSRRDWCLAGCLRVRLP